MGDVGLATGTLSIAQAGDALATRVPVDRATADGEAAFFSSAPGQAISCQIGNLQIFGLLADAKSAQGDRSELDALGKLR